MHGSAVDYEQVKQVAIGFYEYLFRKKNDPPGDFKQPLNRVFPKF